MSKPDWDSYFMTMAKHVSTRGTCDRLQVGAIIASPERRVLATGYNGAPRGWPSCDDIGHMMVQMGERQSCVRTLHAEHNAILQCAIYGVSPRGAICYTTASPCFDCFKMLSQVGVTRIVCGTTYDGARMHGVQLVELARDAGISLEMWAP